MDFNSMKEKIKKKHIIIGSVALVVIIVGIITGIIALGGSDEQMSGNVVAGEITTEPTTTTITTTAVTWTIVNKVDRKKHTKS